MNTETRSALVAINRRFYRRYADEFSAKRRQPWSGWEEVVGRVLPSLEQRAWEPSVLDLGCGNGRFGSYLSERLDGVWRYIGTDRSLELLDLARRRRFAGAARRLLVQSRLGEGEDDLSELCPGSIDLIVGFGLLHHIPGREARRSLLRRCAETLRPGGWLAVSFWQFGDQPERFTRRAVDWHEAGIDRDQVESGDVLLRWGTDPGSGGNSSRRMDSSRRMNSGRPDRWRYCHHSSDEEAANVVAATGLEVARRFRADGRSGRSNLYFLLRR